VAETASFASPILAEPGASKMRLASMTFQVFPEPVVKIVLHQYQADDYVRNGKRLNVLYTGAQATQFMVLVNNANFSNVSMRERVMARLIQDGKLTNVTLT
jgi:hypothetical protein